MSIELSSTSPELVLHEKFDLVESLESCQQQESNPRRSSHLATAVVSGPARIFGFKELKIIPCTSGQLGCSRGYLNVSLLSGRGFNPCSNHLFFYVNQQFQIRQTCKKTNTLTKKQPLAGQIQLSPEQVRTDCHIQDDGFAIRQLRLKVSNLSPLLLLFY